MLQHLKKSGKNNASYDQPLIIHQPSKFNVASTSLVLHYTVTTKSCVYSFYFKSEEYRC